MQIIPIMPSKHHHNKFNGSPIVNLERAEAISCTECWLHYQITALRKFVFRWKANVPQYFVQTPDIPYFASTEN